MNRKELVRRESQLMSAFIESHKRGDVKTKRDVERLIDKNVAARGALKRGAC